jgi:hypothetical protein
MQAHPLLRAAACDEATKSAYLPTCVRACVHTYVRTYAYPTHLLQPSCSLADKGKKTDLRYLLHSGPPDAKEEKIRTEGRVGRRLLICGLSGAD